MISVVEGFGVGAGKSYFAVVQLINHFTRGGTAYVVDTMCIKWEPLKALVVRRYGLLLEDSQYRSVTADQIVNIHEHTASGTSECPVLIVVDECQGALNARDWADKSKRGLFDWATQSRHDDNDLLFISQSALNIDKQLRRIATFNWRIRNSEMLGEGNALRVWLAVWRVISFGFNGGAMFIVNQLDQDGKTPLGKKQMLPHDREIFECYDSKAMRGKHRRNGEEISKVTLTKVSRRTGRVESEKKEVKLMWKYVAGFVLLMMAFGGYKIYRMDWTFGASKREAAFKAPVSSAPVASVIPASAAAEYDVRKVNMLASADGYLKTASGEYLAGEMSPDGFVQAVRGRTARVRQPNGRALYIVGADWTAPSVVAGKDSPVSPRNTQLVVARDVAGEAGEHRVDKK